MRLSKTRSAFWGHWYDDFMTPENLNYLSLKHTDGNCCIGSSEYYQVVWDLGMAKHLFLDYWVNFWHSKLFPIATVRAVNYSILLSRGRLWPRRRPPWSWDRASQHSNTFMKTTYLIGKVSLKLISLCIEISSLKISYWKIRMTFRILSWLTSVCQKTTQSSRSCRHRAAQ